MNKQTVYPKTFNKKIILKNKNKNNKRFLLNYIKNNYIYFNKQLFDLLKNYNINYLIYFCNNNLDISIYLEK